MNDRGVRILTERWTAAKQVYDKSKSDPALKKAILKKMPEKIYSKWDEVDVSAVIQRYDQLNHEFRISFLVLYWFSKSEAERYMVCCPGLSSCSDAPQIFKT